MGKIFISWSKSKSCDIAITLKSFLETFGLNAFVSENDISAGEKVKETIIEKIDECDKLVLCFTNDNKHSPWLLYEAGYARGLGKTVIPFLFDSDPNWHSWLDNPMNYAREINLSKDYSEEIFIKCFDLHDTKYTRDAIKNFKIEIENIKNSHRLIDAECEEFVELLASKDTFCVKNPVYKNKTAYFLTGFETFALWDVIIQSFMYTGKYLWIYGRKNMKIVIGHKELFHYVDEKMSSPIKEGIDFRCLFLDPNSEEVKHAHKNQEIFSSELNSTIERAKQLVGKSKAFQQCFRFYSNKRDEIIIRLDNCIIFSKPHFDENGYPQIITDSKFEVFSALSDRGKKCLEKFKLIWDSAYNMFDS